MQAVESTESVMGSTLLYIAKFPEVQRKVYEEAKRVIGDDSERKLSVDDVSRLTYLEMVINETMRLITPGTVNNRYVGEDLDLG